MRLSRRRRTGALSAANIVARLSACCCSSGAASTTPQHDSGATVGLSRFLMVPPNNRLTFVDRFARVDTSTDVNLHLGGSHVSCPACVERLEPGRRGGLLQQALQCRTGEAPSRVRELCRG